MEEFWREIESIKESSVVGTQEEQPPTTEVKPVDGKGLDLPCGFFPPSSFQGLGVERQKLAH